MQTSQVPASVLRVKTKIIATVGPACQELPLLRQLILAGVDVFRLNFSHGDWDWHTAVWQRIRHLSEELRRPVAVLQDLCGPKLRLGEIPGGFVRCHLGARIWLVPHATGLGNELPVGDPSLLDDLRPGDRVLLADGNVALKVIGKQAEGVETEVTLAGEVRSRQGIASPNARLRLDALTAKDLRDLDWTAAHEVDFVGLSFVRRPEDVEQLRAELRRRGIAAQVIAKIEKAEALEHLEAILQATDGVMIARGDLGIELEVARVPMLQKQIIRKCNELGKPVITATQMLESMRTSTRPTRAEASDVANAILDGTDAVMLSGETAMGQYPVEAVTTMAQIAAETEALLGQWRGGAVCPATGDPVLATVTCAGQLADRIQARLLVAATRSGKTALALSRQRYTTPILGLSDRPATVRRMALYWGVLPVLLEQPRKQDEFIPRVLAWAKAQGLVQRGDRVVFILGTGWQESHYNTILVQEVDQEAP